MINVRRTTAEDYATKLPWRAEIDLSGTCADTFMPRIGPASAPLCNVVAYGNTPEHAISECYLTVGRRACVTLRETESPYPAAGEVK